MDGFGLVPAAVYDGDTPDTAKAAIREQARVVPNQSGHVTSGYFA